MIDDIVVWLMSHPLQTVAGLAGLSIAIGLLLVPGIHLLAGQNHPRC